MSNPLTELEATNLVLAAMGETPINSLSGSMPMVAVVANNHLKETLLEVQGRGWYFNREYHTLQPNNAGTIAVPANTLSVRTIRNSATKKVGLRDGILYNLTPFAHSATWDSSVEVEIIFGLSFNEVPPSARLYVAYLAAELVLSREQGDQLSLQKAQENTLRAYTNLLAEQSAAEPLSLRDNYDVVAGLQSGEYGYLVLN